MEPKHTKTNLLQDAKKVRASRHHTVFASTKCGTERCELQFGCANDCVTPYQMKSNAETVFSADCFGIFKKDVLKKVA